MAIDSRDEKYYKAWMTHHTVSRRGLLRGFFKAGQQTQARIEHQDIARHAGRPPQAIVESLFLRLCNGCGECVSACPYGIIAMNSGKAELQIEYADCDFCHKCADVCQTGALESQVTPDTGLKPVVGTSCLGRMDNYCRLCVMSCPQQAIAFDSFNQVIVDEVRCNGCGKCKLACYHGHISLAPLN
ncbi:ferredoxin-type protein NapF [Budviciaceae bacterium BWR-B9]|uniref:Ferredoxin-type protein NapF n=1 Tax=Limnobaculum allomyrinae TaxID=2791986 RepID=A0ABS1IST5_9GAMM|nr:MULTISPECIES: ferredoxin-type protein NapF [Limnobaculum]MBK5144803.1 ferredoxin-type protein NapF [Limnobaculum allomyrinae]MBV7692466.1 ferredoxin-type protein NapF [Limnobaculum sp. M2-1]